MSLQAMDNERLYALFSLSFLIAEVLSPTAAIFSLGDLVILTIWIQWMFNININYRQLARDYNQSLRISRSAVAESNARSSKLSDILKSLQFFKTTTDFSQILGKKRHVTSLQATFNNALFDSRRTWVQLFNYTCVFTSR